MCNIMPFRHVARFTVLDDLDVQSLLIPKEVEVDIAKPPINEWSVWQPGNKLLDFGLHYCTVERIRGPQCGEVKKVSSVPYSPLYPHYNCITHISSLFLLNSQESR